MGTVDKIAGFKPYYKWNTFNTIIEFVNGARKVVLNLIINGIPSILIQVKQFMLTLKEF